MTGGIEIVGLERKYAGRGGKVLQAVAGLDLSVAPGTTLGLLGPNGAGKTTTVKVLMTVLAPTGGRVLVAGFDVERQTKQVRRRVGFVIGGERGLYDRLSALDNLRYFADLYGVSGADQRRRIPELLELVGLRGRERDKVETYSRGMKQRLHIARGLVHDPSVVLLDEPTNGLDPVAARQLRQLIGELARSGRTVLLTTHYMHEADALCGQIAVIVKGRKIAEGTSADIKRAADGRQVTSIETFDIDDTVLTSLSRLDGVVSAEVENIGQARTIHLHTAMDVDITAAALAHLRDTRVGRVHTRQPSLEDAYVALVGGVA